MPNFLIYCEHQDGQAKKSALEIVGKASELAAGGEVVAAVLGSGLAGDYAELAHHGATKILKADDAGLAQYTPEGHAAVLTAMVEATSPRVVLAASSPDWVRTASTCAQRATASRRPGRSSRVRR